MRPAHLLEERRLLEDELRYAPVQRASQRRSNAKIGEMERWNEDGTR